MQSFCQVSPQWKQMWGHYSHGLAVIKLLGANWDRSLYRFDSCTRCRLLSSRASPARTKWEIPQEGVGQVKRVAPVTETGFNAACVFDSYVECLINLFSASWLKEQEFGAGPEWWPFMCELGRRHPHSPVKLLPAEAGAGGTRHALIPQHPDPRKPVLACSP